ncbi:MAG: type III secretion system export apparatus subunit SctR [Deltaproteobacteria bacterium]|nr:type III secretion system export apparatus subunit SctR [Deltaproteobacteria bacterium]MBI2500721.1 type III secretion system export apparatus subunit SctR [Deltaproteobacteria bacterium]
MRGNSLKAKINKLSISLLLIPLLFLSDTLAAQAGDFGGLVTPGQAIARPLVLLMVLAGISVIPFVVMMTTSFVKIAVVLALIRTALGTQQIPPNTIITGLALILSVYIMIPVGLEVYQVAGGTIQQGSSKPFLSDVTVSLLVKGVQEGREPVRQFLLKHTHKKEQELFYNLARKMRKDADREKVTDKDFTILVPSFVISELSEAFQIGFIIFLPFLVIDIVVTNILLSLGMFQISPITVSLPFKLLLFVLVDGWYLIAKGLILGYL